MAKSTTVASSELDSIAIPNKPKEWLTKGFPGEVRNIIWASIFQGQVSMQAIIHSQTLRKPNEGYGTPNTSRKAPSILLVSKQVRKEVLPFYYQNLSIRLGGARRSDQAYPHEISLVLQRLASLQPWLTDYTQSVDFILANLQIEQVGHIILKKLLNLPKLKHLKITVHIPAPNDPFFDAWSNPSKHMPLKRIEHLLDPLMEFDNLATLTLDSQWIESEPWGWEQAKFTRHKKKVRSWIGMCVDATYSKKFGEAVLNDDKSITYNLRVVREHNQAKVEVTDAKKIRVAEVETEG